jgi:exosortase
MVEQWSADEDMGHGFVVPFVIAWVIWRERDRWRRVRVQPSLWGYALLAAGGGLQLASVLGVGLFAGSLAFLLSSIGAILCLGGFAIVRIWAFPLLLAVFMLPKLAIVYNQLTLPLQLLASRLATALLSVAGIHVLRQGNILNVGGHQVAVAEACNGVRYLLPLALTGLVLGYIADRKVWMRAALFAAAIPVAIVANGFRVAVSAAAPPLSEGAWHALCGWLIFVLCLGALIGAHKLFNVVYARAHA